MLQHTAGQDSTGAASEASLSRLAVQFGRGFLEQSVMALSRHDRGKKDRVAPMSDDDDQDDGNSVSANHLHSSRRGPAPSRGVSFTSPRGKIWLLLVANLCIVTGFIFVSSTQFPSLWGENVVTSALTQDEHSGHPGPMNKNSEQVQVLASARPKTATGPSVHDTSRSGGYTKLTSDSPRPEERDQEDHLFGIQNDVDGDTKLPASDLPLENELGTESRESPHKGTETLPSTQSVPTSAGINSPMDFRAKPAAVVDENLQVPMQTPPNAGGQSPAEIAEIIAQMKLQGLPPTLGGGVHTQPASSDMTTLVPSTVKENLLLWLTADSGVTVHNLASCLASSGADATACAVNSWANQIARSSTAFHAISSTQQPVWVPIAADTHHQLPVVYFSCPMVCDALKVHDSMTLFFVIAPALVESGDSFKGQKFFGNSPYGQFGLHGGKPSFFANNGLQESEYELPEGQFSLVAYRLNENAVEIKVNDKAWGGGAQPRNENRIRISANDVVSLGNAKLSCDTNAFQGRIAEVQVYDALLDDTAVQTVVDYLHGKWWGQKPLPTVVAGASSSSEAVIQNQEQEQEQTESPTAGAAKMDPGPTPVTHHQDAAASLRPTSSPPEATDALEKVPFETEEATPAPKFDPKINIFEWKPASSDDAAKADQWTTTVEDKVSTIRNFQLGGDVLRALIRQHHDELLALREQLFG